MSTGLIQPARLLRPGLSPCPISLAPLLSAATLNGQCCRGFAYNTSKGHRKLKGSAAHTKAMLRNLVSVSGAEDRMFEGGTASVLRPG